MPVCSLRDCPAHPDFLSTGSSAGALFDRFHPVCCHLKTAHIAIAVIYGPKNIFIVNLKKIKNKKELK
jgi:hypothetical protein